MAIDNFIPEIWAAGVTQSFISNQIVIPTLNTQFTGAVTRGNQVHVINATTPTIVDYAAAGRSITAEALGDTEVLLAIDQEKAFSVNVDDVDAVQASSQFGPWVESAGRALAEDAENYVVPAQLTLTVELLLLTLLKRLRLLSARYVSLWLTLRFPLWDVTLS